MIPCRIAGRVAVCAWLACLSPGLADAQPADPSASLRVAASLSKGDAHRWMYDLRVPGGVAGVLEAAGLRPTPEPSLGLLAAIRALHNSRAPTAAQIRLAQAVLARIDSFSRPSEVDDIVPLPLSPQIWASVVFTEKTPREPAAAIVTDRRAALCYHGLMSLDEPTLAFLAANTRVLSAILDQALPVFATYGRSIHVKDGLVQVPGGARAQPLWEMIVGAPPSEASRFILALLTRDEGRCAYFYDTVAHLDETRRSDVLGLAHPENAAQGVRRLYRVFTSFLGGQWRPMDFPFLRRTNDPAWALMHLSLGVAGGLAPPASLSLWTAVFDGRAAMCQGVSLALPGQPIADVSWTLERLFAQTPDRRAQMLETIAFAQRVFASSGPASGPAVCETLIAFPSYQGLLLSLESIGGLSPVAYASVVGSASALKGDDQLLYLVQVQGALAIVERAVAAQSLSRDAARLLVRALFDFTSPNERHRLGAIDGRPVRTDAMSGHVEAWMRTALLPGLGCVVQSADDCLAGAAGGPPASTAPIISWEGERYRIDYRSSARERARRVRSRQQANRLSDVLTFFEAARALLASMSAGSDTPRRAAMLQDAAAPVHLGDTERFGVGSLSVDTIVKRVAQVGAPASGADPASKGAALTALLKLADTLLADALTSFVYTISIRDPDSSLLLAGDPARRHDFGRGYANLRAPNGPWRVPEERHMPDNVWIVQGSLLGLPRVLAPFSVRRLSADSEGVVPMLDELDAHALAESALALDPASLTDGDRDRIVAAVSRGRARLTALLADPSAFTSATAGLGISEWRAAGACWLARRSIPRAIGLFSMTEMFWLGEAGSNGDGPAAPDAWGVATRSIDASWHLRLPRGHAWEDVGWRGSARLLGTQVADLNLRIAECLAQLGLPSSLAAGIASYAVWDFTMGAEMSDPDDWLGLVRAAQMITTDRVSDYVSALTAPDGPLVPVK